MLTLIESMTTESSRILEKVLSDAHLEYSRSLDGAKCAMDFLQRAMLLVVSNFTLAYDKQRHLNTYHETFFSEQQK